ncbi:MAG: B12-binding domain-containing radical SAM protein [Candidatus Omnitrophica bacterium]|nr:B12-binding domain-containing radical SAM protein [Candidatus Omnitrophota bacterium]
MKITFISLFPDLTAFGLRAVASFLKRENHEIQLIFLPDPDFDRIQSPEERSRYTYPETMMEQLEFLVKDSNLVGISLFTCYFPQAVLLTKRFKALKIPVLWGGKHPSAVPEGSLKYADIVCVGEGEEAVLELVSKMQRGKDYLNTQNFWFSTPEGIIKNPVRPLLKDLNSLPLMDYSFCPHYVWLKDKGTIEPLNDEILKRFLPRDPFSESGRVYQTLSTRGCPYNCTYCYTFKGLYKDPQYVRQRSVDNIIKELETIKKRYDFVTHISLCDDEFIAQKIEKLEEFSKKYKKRIGLSLSCLGSPRTVNEEKIKTLVNAGLCLIQMGIETVSENGKKVYERTIPNTRIMAAVETINKYRNSIIPEYDFIIDNPYETTEDILENIRFILKIPRPYHLNIFSLVLFPGTKLYQNAMESGAINNAEENYLKVYRNYEKRYLNLIFQLFNYPVPGSIMRFLISMPMVFLFETKGLGRFLFYIMDVLKKTNIRKFMDRFRAIRVPHG